MTIRNIFALAVMTSLFLVSCEKNEVLVSEENEDAVQLITEIKASIPNSRIDLELEGKGTFIEGDSISLLYSDGVQKDLTQADSRWTPSFSWNEIGSQATFSAFYPTIPDDNQTFKHTVELDQRIGNNFERSALLFARPVQVNKGEAVHLKFDHLMSCITIVLKGNLYTQEQLEKAVVKLKAYNQYEVERNGTLKHLYNYEDNILNVPEITLKRRNGSTFQAIVCPQKFDVSFMGWLSIQIDGKHYTIPEPPEYLLGEEPFKGFESGKRVTLTYSFNKKVPEGKGKRIMVSGITIPDPDTSAEWKPNGPALKHLPWKPGYKWYDCNKKKTNDGSYDDQNLCWAATGSNMLHWWFDFNKDNIEKYCKINKIDFNTIPHNYVDHHNSDIFDYYKKNFTDDGSFTGAGLKWFLTGVYDKQHPDAASLLDSKSGGFFKDVFGNHPVFLSRQIGSSLEDFSAFLKEGLENDMAVGFDIRLEGFRFRGHAMTIWGADFDPYGLVTAIYYLDNNDGTIDSGPNPTGLIKARVQANKSGVCMEGSTGEIKIPIMAVTLLKSGKQEWDNYFKTHSEK